MTFWLKLSILNKRFLPLPRVGSQWILKSHCYWIHWLSPPYDTSVNMGYGGTADDRELSIPKCLGNDASKQIQHFKWNFKLQIQEFIILAENRRKQFSRSNRLALFIHPRSFWLVPRNILAILCFCQSPSIP